MSNDRSDSGVAGDVYDVNSEDLSASSSVSRSVTQRTDVQQMTSSSRLTTTHSATNQLPRPLVATSGQQAVLFICLIAQGGGPEIYRHLILIVFNYSHYSLNRL